MLERIDTGTSLIKTGRVKWFSMMRHYGFMTPDDGTREALFHKAVLQAGGFRVPPEEGAAMKCEVFQSERGPKVSKILSLEEPEVAPPPAIEGRFVHRPNIARLSSFLPAQVRFFNSVKGFGFLIVDGAFEDVFLHKEILRRCSGRDILERDQMVLVRYGVTPQGRLAAAEVRLDDIAG
ncbi:MAG TPA: cold shock domain-containing protein [Candidatus Paceibacterota bacterium]